MPVLIERDPDRHNRIRVTAPYHYNELIKTIPGARWSNAHRTWTIPLAWTACLAARGVFGDDLEIGTELRLWATQEKERRITPAMALRDALEADGDSDLYGYQRAGVQFLTTTERALLTDEPGCGKSATTIRTMKALDARGDTPFPALIVSPNTVKKTWQREFEQWWPDVEVQVVEGAATKRRKQIEKVAAVTVVNWEALRVHSRLIPYGSMALKRCEECGGSGAVKPNQCQVHERELNRIEYMTVVGDECFTGDTIIDTPRGRRTIASLSVGDTVWGYDEETGRVVETAVTETMARKSDVLSGFVTPDHPVRIVGDAYRPVRDITRNDEVITLDQQTKTATSVSVPGVRRRRLSDAGTAQSWQEVLLEVMRQQSEVQGGSESQRSQSPEHVRNRRTCRCSGEIERAFVRINESVPFLNNAGQSSRSGDGSYAGVELLTIERWEWEAITGSRAYAAGTFERWMDCGIGGAYGTVDCPRCASTLQGGYRAPSTNDCGGSRREQSQFSSSPREGCQKRLDSALTRMDGSEILESRDPTRSNKVRGTDRAIVYNLTTTTSNYFVDGVLVHNCHRVKNPKSLTTLAFKGATGNARFRYALTGTPIANDPSELWSLLNWIDPDEWPSRRQWVERLVAYQYNVWGGMEVTGVKPETEPEFRAGVDPRMRRMTKEIVLPQLPPKVFEQRDVPMAGKQKDAYEQMVADLAVQLDTGVLLAANAMVQTGRLVQFASSFGDVSVDADGNENLTLSEPSNKVDAFMADLEDFEGQSVAVFAESRQLIYLLSDAMKRKDIRHGLITGKQDEETRQRTIEDFQAGNFQFVLCTIKAGGVGITLNKASVAVFLQRSWSSVDMEQAYNRVHRIGSEVHDSVLIVNYVTPDSIEEAQLWALKHKRDLLQEVVRDKDLLLKILGGGFSV